MINSIVPDFDSCDLEFKIPRDNETQNLFIEQIKEIEMHLKIKTGFSAFLKDCFENENVILFVINEKFDIFLGTQIHHIEICWENAIDETLTIYGYIQKHSYKEISFSVRRVPFCLEKYLPILGETKIKEIIKNKILSFFKIMPL